MHLSYLRVLTIDHKHTYCVRFEQKEPTCVASLRSHVGSSLLERERRAGDVMTTVTERMGGRGGGKDDMAQGGGGDPAQIEAAFADVGAAIGRARG